jgi:hypothetical protein
VDAHIHPIGEVLCRDAVGFADPLTELVSARGRIGLRYRGRGQPAATAAAAPAERVATQSVAVRSTR